ncbi:hypothetical protein HU200_053858 [Digitaria exilis]|uniref:Uncharacterized protein n=1 Tax=Digitaria exilis TaxID=1010633 RepID=A0A835ANN0_9POAL|nr:hypothetical protein HU200_053858 [Digitaria exilis]
MWAMWCTRRFPGAYYQQFWSLLQHGNTREIICSASKTLETVALDIFANNGRRNNNRL